ncbi:thiamine pyrophosphate-dependent acetolactate synthase large subunit-like protein [Microterricola gilva]|uniref:Thiamine pyrophosphate-dependent acetolactate synthase large subunit-like protein n=1 Tax=Microterricola gilva TaxID=393267 RepID=A0A4Q8AQC9_9MICO|nr:thiamine pyrophosphate-binding protein [Microterricola gilva]RZU66265.1 thiamine pyrophosphate-dependent acetolactate synthase large subunit-like protein [Microterricola gilva]
MNSVSTNTVTTTGATAPHFSASASSSSPSGSRGATSAALPAAPTVSARVAEALAGHISDVFGLMGNGNAYFIDALSATSAAFTAVRHETAAVAAADAYYRAGGRIAAGTVTYGAGFTNTATALAEAAQARIPLVLVVGDAPTTGMRPWDIEQSSFAASLGVPTIVVNAEDATRQTIHAIDRALARRSPVVLAIPYDLAAAPSAERTGDPAPLVRPPHPVRPDHVDTDAAAAAIAAAERPLLLAGQGAWTAGAGEALGRLAELSGAVTASTALGRGIFPRPEFDLGVTGGFGQEAAMHLVGTADVVLVVGASLNQFTMQFGALIPAGTTVIRIDDEERSHPIVTHFVHGDARLAVEAIVDRIERLQSPPSGWRESVTGLRDGSLRARPVGEAELPDGQLDPRLLATRLAALLPEDRVVVSDGGHFIGWANMYWPIASPNRMVMVGTAFQTIGLGFPSAVGAARALPDSTVVVTTGDGGGLMALADLDSVIRAAHRAIIVVWNDAAYGAEVHVYGRLGLGQGPMQIEQADFAALGRALGARGSVIRTLADLAEFEQWLADAGTGTFVLDCRVSPSIVAPFQDEIYAVNAGKR